MAFWNRKKNGDAAQLPAEYEQYYQAEANDRRNSARLVSIGVIVLAVLILSGLFFGVRALYRRSQANDTANVPGASQEVQTPPEASDTPAQTDTNTEDNSQNPENPSTPAPAPAPTTPPTPPTTPTSTPSTTSSVTTVPGTGIDE